jgi:hypothetical protein
MTGASCIRIRSNDDTGAVDNSIKKRTEKVVDAAKVDIDHLVSHLSESTCTRSGHSLILRIAKEVQSCC